MTTATFDIDDWQPPTPEEKAEALEVAANLAVDRTKNRQRVAASRFRHRTKAVRERAEQKVKDQTRPLDLLRQEWERRFEQLSDEEAGPMLELSHQCSECMTAIIASKNDIGHALRTFLQWRDFVLAHLHHGYAGLPNSQDVLAMLCAEGVSEEELTRGFADATFIKYGLFSGISGIIWNNYCEKLLKDLRTNAEVEGYSSVQIKSHVSDIEALVVAPWLRELQE